jgi:hypothetical protein
MKSLLYIPIVLSLAALGAHFMRDGNQVGVAGSLILIALLVVRRVWVARVVQAALILGAIEWLLTLQELSEYMVSIVARIFASDRPASRLRSRSAYPPIAPVFASCAIAVSAYA